MKPEECPRCRTKVGLVSYEIDINGRKCFRISCYKCKADAIVDSDDKRRDGQ